MYFKDGELILDDNEITIRPNIFIAVKGNDTPSLLARQCSDCGDISFPPFIHCLKCNSEIVTEEKVLSNDAKLVAFTIARQVMPGFIPNYILANVSMKDDPSLILTCQLTDVKHDDVEIGMELTMIPKIIKQLMNGQKVISYCFRPKDPSKLTLGEGGQTQ